MGCEDFSYMGYIDQRSVIRQDYSLSRLWHTTLLKLALSTAPGSAPSGFAPRWSFLAAVPTSCGSTHSIVINQCPLKVKRLRIVSPRTILNDNDFDLGCDFVSLCVFFFYFFYYLFNAIWLYRCHKLKIRMRCWRCRLVTQCAHKTSDEISISQMISIPTMPPTWKLPTASAGCLAGDSHFQFAVPVQISEVGNVNFVASRELIYIWASASLYFTLCFIIHWKRRWRWWGRGDVADDVVVVLSEIKQKSGQSKKKKETPNS